MWRPYHSLLHTVLSVHVIVNMIYPCCLCCRHNLHMTLAIALSSVIIVIIVVISAFLATFTLTKCAIYGVSSNSNIWTPLKPPCDQLKEVDKAPLLATILIMIGKRSMSYPGTQDRLHICNKARCCRLHYTIVTWVLVPLPMEWFVKLKIIQINPILAFSGDR